MDSCAAQAWVQQNPRGSSYPTISQNRALAVPVRHKGLVTVWCPGQCSLMMLAV